MYAQPQTSWWGWYVAGVGVIWLCIELLGERHRRSMHSIETFLAEISVVSSSKLFSSIINIDVYRIKIFNKTLDLILKKDFTDAHQAFCEKNTQTK